MRVGSQDLWVIVFDFLSRLKQQHLIRVDDRVDAMRDRKHGRLFEGAFNQLLDLFLSHDVDVGGSLIQHDNLVLAEDGPADADQLLLAGGEGRPVTFQLEVDSFAVASLSLVLLVFVLVGLGLLRDAGQKIVETGFSEHLFALFIGAIAFRIEVELDRAGEDNGVLRDHSDVLPQDVHGNSSDGLSVDEDLASGQLDYARKGSS